MRLKAKVAPEVAAWPDATEAYFKDAENAPLEDRRKT